MSVPGPECGREYDVTLFRFGHTVQCDCGARIALNARTACPPAHCNAFPAPRCIADAMLGKLARALL